MNRTRIAWASALVACVAGACSPGGPLKSGIAPGEIIGSVEISPSVPAANCRVFFEGTPIGARCDESGEFDLRNVPPGRWDLRIVIDDAATAIPARRIAAGSNSGQVSDLGVVAVAQAGSIGGLVQNVGGADLSLAIVAVPEVGAVTAPNANGGYLLDAVAPGLHDVELVTTSGTVIHSAVTVQPAKLTVPVNLDLGTVAAQAAAKVTVTGFALRDGLAANQHAGIRVELVESLDGTTVDMAQSAANGSFSLSGVAGTYIVRATDGENPAHPIVPSLVLNGRDNLSLSSVLSVPAVGGDQNGNGIPDDKDPDIDGDGFANAMDAFPYDPAEWLDTDKDGVGDRADLRSKGGKGIDHDVPTPDTDGDGVLDFADNCPKKPNADQKDSDSDGWGDVCDNCPFVYNPDQKDSLGNGVGDACRACMRNEDCGSGKLCEFGSCVSCISNQQCGNQVCSKLVGACVACSAQNPCDAPLKCDGTLGLCVQCTVAADCGANQACVNDRCVSQCTMDAQCPGGFCVNGGCVACRGNADCPLAGQWCDGGLCRAQCVFDGDCDGGRSCDPKTHTCFAPCNGMCAMGQTCQSGMCLDVCDLSKPCPMGRKCSSGACVPECAADADCVGVRPFTICSAGQCVPSGKCALDSDCAVADLCVSGTCAARPTMMVPGKGYSCGSPCDCRMGETCSSGFCTADPAPRWFAVAGGSGASSDVTKPGDLGAALAAAKAGDTVAIAAGASIAGSFSITQSKVTLAGGYQVCAPNRWVRDPSQTSTLHGAAGAVLAIPGSNVAAFDHVVVENLKLVMDDWKKANYALSASYAPALTLTTVAATLAAPQPVDTTTQASTAFLCDHCAGVTFTALSLTGLNAGDQTTIKMVDLPSGSGTLDAIAAGAVHAGRYYGVLAQNPTGALTIKGATLDGFQGSYGGGGVVVQNAAAGTVTIDSCTIGYGTYRNNVGYQFDGNSHWDPIGLTSCTDIAVTSNLVDGRGLDETGVQVVTTNHYGMNLTDCNGTVSGNTVHVSNNPAVNNAYAYYIAGPSGNLAFTNNSGTSANALDGQGYLAVLLATGIVRGTLSISYSDLSAGGSALGDASAGIYLLNVNSYLIADTTARGPDMSNGNSSYGLYGNLSSGRLERCKIYGGTSAGNSFGAAFYGASQTELNDSFLVAGTSANQTFGLWAEGQLTANSNTIDAANSAARYTSTGFLANSCIGAFTGNLLSGGWAGYHAVVRQDPSRMTFAYNYFWYPGLGVPWNLDVYQTYATNGNMPDKNHNIDGGRTGCYDGGFAPPDYHLAAGSACIDKGPVKPVRLDGSSIDTDIDGGKRVLGAASDIGCWEHP